MYTRSYGNAGLIFALGWGKPLSFALPEKGDLDRKLSELMHHSRHQLEIVLQSEGQPWKAAHGRVVVHHFALADQVHKEAMEAARLLLGSFVQRTGRPAVEVVGWGRPHLENLNRSLIGLVRPAGVPEEYGRESRAYEAIFSQRLASVLRDAEIGYETAGGFAPSFAGAVAPFSEVAGAVFEPDPMDVPRVIEATIEERIVLGDSVSVERRLSERPQDIREAARALSRAISEQIAELSASRLNDPDAIDKQSAFIAFLQQIAEGLDNLAISLDAVIDAGAPETKRSTSIYAATVARGLATFVKEGFDKQRAALQACVIQVPVLTGSVWLLHTLGVDPTAAFTGVCAIMGLKTIFKGETKE